MCFAVGEERRGQLQRVRGQDVVVGESVNQKERSLEFVCIRNQTRRFVWIGIRRRIAEVALRVVRVVEAPVRDRCSGDRSMESIGGSEHGESGEIAAKAPPTNRDPRHIGVWMDGCEFVEYGELVVEHRTRKVERNFSFPCATEPWRPRAVGDHDDEPLVGEPLRRAVRGRRCDDALCVWTSVGIKEDGEYSTVVMTRCDDCGRNSACAESVQGHVWCDEW